MKVKRYIFFYQAIFVEFLIIEILEMNYFLILSTRK